MSNSCRVRFKALSLKPNSSCKFYILTTAAGVFYKIRVLFWCLTKVCIVTVYFIIIFIFPSILVLDQTSSIRIDITWCLICLLLELNELIFKRQKCWLGFLSLRDRRFCFNSQQWGTDCIISRWFKIIVRGGRWGLPWSLIELFTKIFTHRYYY